MSNDVTAPPPGPGAPAPMPGDRLRPVEPGFTHVLRITTALTLIPVAIALTVLDLLLIRHVGGPWGMLTVAAWMVAILVTVTAPARRVARWGYAMADDRLRVARGWLFRTDTVVPFVRVQHIDVGQGPIERAFSLSHLIVHTSGTHNSMVRLPGLRPDDAAKMRETIRRHIQSDFA